MCVLVSFCFLLRADRQEIVKLREEQEELLRSLCVSECQALRQSDSQDTQSLRTLLERSDMLDEQLESERQTQSQLKQEVPQTQTHSDVCVYTHAYTALTKKSLSAIYFGFWCSGIQMKILY